MGNRWKFLCIGPIRIINTALETTTNAVWVGEEVDDGDNNEDKQYIPADARLISSSDNLYECNSFSSWIQTKFIRFLVSLSICGLSGIAATDTWWRFVPDPGTFDHLFTDTELYNKYRLDIGEIDIIESLIKEKK